MSQKRGERRTIYADQGDDLRILKAFLKAFLQIYDHACFFDNFAGFELVVAQNTVKPIQLPTGDGLLQGI